MRLFALLLLTITGFAADFKTGLEAYNRGDFAAALKEWQPIAEAGDANAQYNLGLLFARGQGVPQDYAKAAEWYTKAAEQGVPAAEYNLGLMYANGQGVTANAKEAAKWFLEAAEHGVADAASGLGRVYNEGEGAFHDYAEAEKWYRKAADEGVASAAYNLGVMYDVGQGVTKNYEQAMKWYRKAADAGYAPALTNLGILYYNAQGVDRDLVQAYAWFSRAQEVGDPRAAYLLQTTAKRMTSKDVKKGQTLAAEWKPPAGNTQPKANAELFKGPQPAAASPQTASAAESAAPAVSAANTAPQAKSKTESGADRLQSVRDVWTGVDRVIVVGDVHGDYEQFVGVLESAGLIDGNGNWTGGKTHLVQTGDVVDRGPDSRAVMDLLMRLEKQAAAAGGAVHALIGNHEAMNVYGDLRFVSPGEFSSYTPGSSGDLNASSYQKPRASLTEMAKPEGPGSFPLENPPGFEQQRAAFSANGVYGRWIRGHNAAIKIGRTLFVHAGLGPKYADWPLEKINEQVRAELNDFTRLHGGIDTDEEGPLWYRGLASGDEEKLAPLVDELLRHFDVERIVIGHSYANAAITPRFGGKVVLVDIGLSRVYDNIGKMGALEIDGNHAFALHRGQKLELPKDEDGPDMLRYLREAAALDPQPSPLAPRIAALEKK